MDVLGDSLQGAGISWPPHHTMNANEEQRDPQGFTDIQSKELTLQGLMVSRMFFR